eukprot:sb/3463413/
MMMLETDKKLLPDVGTPGTTTYKTVHIADKFFMSFFTFDVILRIISWPSHAKCGYFTTPMNIIDLVALSPYYVQHGVSLLSVTNSMDVVSILRASRLLRMVRIFRFIRHSEELFQIIRFVYETRSQLAIIYVFSHMVVLVFGAVMYYTEGGDQFNSILNASWWSLVTLSTLGYGDTVPITLAGCMVGSVALMMGMVILSLPMTIVVSKFAEWHENEKKSRKGCQSENCGQSIGRGGLMIASSNRYELMFANKKRKRTFNLYHIGGCYIENWRNRFLHDVAWECHNRIISRVPHLGLVKKHCRLKVTSPSVVSGSIRYNENEIISMEDLLSLSLASAWACQRQAHKGLSLAISPALGEQPPQTPHEETKEKLGVTGDDVTTVTSSPVTSFIVLVSQDSNYYYRPKFGLILCAKRFTTCLSLSLSLASAWACQRQAHKGLSLAISPALGEQPPQTPHEETKEKLCAGLGFVGFRLFVPCFPPWLVDRPIAKEDIGYCYQYGCSVLVIVKRSRESFEAIGLLCASLKDATTIQELISHGYKAAKHPNFANTAIRTAVLTVALASPRLSISDYRTVL